MEQLRKLRSISLTEPLAEKVRPKSFDDIVGQEDGIKALKAALCGPNPQHVIIYGPPGVGKTAAARLVLEEAKKNPLSPFKQNAAFVELDATTARFDERGIADPLIGSVHDPIYQGAGAMGQAGIPQPKQGAVTNAHGGILFIDEIGELHPIQMNKLLKVLEDRKVFLKVLIIARKIHKFQATFMIFSKTGFQQISGLSVRRRERQTKFLQLSARGVWKCFSASSTKMKLRSLRKKQRTKSV